MYLKYLRHNFYLYYRVVIKLLVLFLLTFVFIVNLNVYPSIDNFFINSNFLNVFIELTCLLVKFYHVIDDLQNIHFLLMLDFSSILVNIQSHILFLMVHNYHMLLIIVLLKLVYQYLVYLIVKSLFQLMDTFINGFDNIFYLHEELYDVNLCLQ